MTSAKILTKRGKPLKRISKLPQAKVAAVEIAAIHDAYTDQDGKRWVQYGFANRSVTFAVEDFVRNETDVVARLVNIGALTPSAKDKAELRIALGVEREFPIRIVANRAGWATDDCFVFGDATLAIKPGSRTVPIQVTPDARFAARGSLSVWQAGMGDLIAEHPVVASLHAIGLAGAFMRFLPPDVTNPIFEISSKPEKGKTSLAISAAAFWGDDPSSRLGMATSFNATTNALEDRQHEFNDMLLMIDEVNLAENNSRVGDELANVVFRLERGVGRRRHGDGGAISSRGAILFTSNKPLVSYVQQGEKREAVASRIVSLVLPDSIFEGLPRGFTDQQAAVQQMLSVARANGGIVGRALVQRILNRRWKNTRGLRGAVLAQYKKVARNLEAAGLALNPRAKNCFATMIVASDFATYVGVFKSEWQVSASVLEIAQRVASASIIQAGPPSEVDRVRAYLAAKGFDKPNLKNQAPLEGVHLRESDGVEYFTRASERMIAIHPEAFRFAFPDHLSVMRALRDAGLAQTEEGANKRLSIKAPTSVCAGERIYSLRADRIMATK